MERLVYQELASTLIAMENCKKDRNDIWYDRHEEKIDYIVKNYLPHGSGIDNKTEIDMGKSNDNRIVINSEYHCMDEHGFYDGWVSFKVVISSCLMFGFRLKITGKFGKYSHVKNYLYDLYYYNLSQIFTQIENNN